jgi:ribonuclease T1
MLKKYNQLIVGLIGGLLIGLLIAKFAFFNKSTNPNPPYIPSTNNNQQVPRNNNRNNGNTNHSNNNEVYNEPSIDANISIPAKVYAVLQYIKANDKAKDGYVGGRVFTNRQKVLPYQNETGEIILYQEWDVNPKIEGKNRGTERICTGNDNRSWYTNDHYKSFTLIK